MAQPQSPSISIRFDGLGWETSLVKDYSIDSAYMTSTDAFSFSLYEPDITKLQGLELQPVSIYIDGNLQLRGRVEQSEIGHDNATVRLQGRDYLADMVECHVDPALALKENMTLEQATKLAARPVGISTVSFDARPWRNARLGVPVSTTQGVREFEKAPLKDYKPNPGEGIFQFLSRLCVRFGCTIQPSMERNTVVLGAPDYDQEVAYSVYRSRSNPQSAQNNVLSATAKRDYSKFPSIVLVSGQASSSSAQTRKTIAASSDTGPQNPGLIPTIYRRLFGEAETGGASTATPITTKSSSTTGRDEKLADKIANLIPDKYNTSLDLAVITTRLPPSSNFVPFQGMFYRLLYIRDKLGKDTKQIANTATRSAAERLKDCLQYDIVFRGHKDPATGRTFTPDTVIQVSDDICGVSEKLWVERVNFSYEPGVGAKTQLTCWRPGSFEIGAS